MLCYINEKVWTGWRDDTPTVLQQKKFAKIENDFLEYGFPATASDTGWLQVSTTGRSLQETIAFLEAAAIAAVTVEPVDAINFLGRNIVGLAVKRSLEMYGAEALGLALLEPDQLVDALETVQLQTINDQSSHDDAEVGGGVMDEILLHDLTAHGLLTEAQIAGSNRRDPFEVESRSPNVDGFGIRPEKDLSDFFPDGDDPWGRA